MVKRNSSFSLRIDNYILDDIETKVKENKFSSVSDAIRECVKVGLKFYSYREIMENPQQQTLFFQELNSKMNEKNFLEWINSLSDDKFQALVMATNLRIDAGQKR